MLSCARIERKGYCSFDVIMGVLGEVRRARSSKVEE